ncbi:MAG: hypothetical protein HQL82_03745 [Magnetococcales bacterium]|nr:hypothetical protein [Magnetococcales bacterium]
MLWSRLVVMILVLLLSGSIQAQGSDAVRPAGGWPGLKGDKCIQPTDWMRKNHMEFLKQRREVTVREGVRIRDESLLQCQTCHTSRQAFCDRCHQYVGVHPDCFDCHIYPK